MHRPATPPMEIRDPIHGVIRVTEDELAVIEHPFVQRLRGVRQLGFSHLPFPGATHSRYAHSLGAMELAGQAFDACFSGVDLEDSSKLAAWRSALRLAALCHDLGHPPFSHAAEFAMPPLVELGVTAYDHARVGKRSHKRASHEDYTIAILTKSSLCQTIEARFGFSALFVAGLVSKEVLLPSDGFFQDGGLDYRGLLSQLISSELDVDRLDYLVRDSYYTGARYGEIDARWLISHLSRHVDSRGRVFLALDHRAIYAFDDLMISRFHMFVMVYYHQKSIACEVMLQRYMEDPGCDYRLPADLDAYLHHDDAELLTHIRRSSNPVARDLVEGRLWRVALEVHGTPGEVHVEARRRLLEELGIPVIATTSTGAVFKPARADTAPIYVLDRGHGRAERTMLLHEATTLFHRYQDERAIARLYVPGDRVIEARARLVEGA